MTKKTGIDIVVPVYEDLDHLKLCVDSICKYTDLSIHRMILIHDRRLNEEIMSYLHSLKDNGIGVLENEQKSGYLGSINYGIRCTDRDVILLHADTIVTRNWIEKMVECAYSDRAIGTVTPFSNNTTPCAAPKLREVNMVPYGLTIDEYADVIERSSLKKYPHITASDGFCMFIKRELIRQIGAFDQDAFQYGIGAAKDFCWRAEQLGYYHVLCDDVYIYHSGTCAFLDDEKIAEQNIVLQRRYIKQFQKNLDSACENIYHYLQTNIDIYARLHNRKKNILYVLQSDFRSDVSNNIGGTQFHVKDLTMGLCRDNNIFVMARDSAYLRLTAYLENEQIPFKFFVGDKSDFPRFYNKEIAKVMDNILSAFSINLVHVHHLFNLSFDIVEVAKERGIPVLMSLHDYYYICPTVKLLEDGKYYCAGSGINCIACMNKQLGYCTQIDYLKIWQARCYELLRHCDVLISPSDAARDVYVKCYPELIGRIQVIEHGMDAFALRSNAFRKGETSGFEYAIEQAFDNNYEIYGWAIQANVNSQSSEISLRVEDTTGKHGEFRALAVNRPDLVAKKSSNAYLSGGFKTQIPDTYFESGDLKVQIMIRDGKSLYHSGVIIVSGYTRREKVRKRVAFLGGTSEAKGSQIVCQMMKQGGNKYDWYVFGGISDPELLTFEKANVYKTGWYKRENINAILHQNQIDLVCILSIWPETFCYTLSEAELAGIPSLGTDIGALGDRIRNHGTGWLIQHDATIKEYLCKIDEIFGDEQEFARVSARTSQFAHKSIEQMCSDYANLYNSLPNSAVKYTGHDTQMIYRGYIMCNEDESTEGSVDKELIYRVNELEAALDAINQNMEYRMVKFVNRDTFPFKRQFKWLVRIVYRVYAYFLK